MIACLHKVEEVQAQFADIFVQMDGGNYEAAKDFIVTDGFLQIRDAFINGTMEYWDGSTYIPVSREYVILKRKGNAVLNSPIMMPMKILREFLRSGVMQ